MGISHISCIGLGREPMLRTHKIAVPCVVEGLRSIGTTEENQGQQGENDESEEGIVTHCYDEFVESEEEEVVMDEEDVLRMLDKVGLPFCFSTQVADNDHASFQSLYLVVLGILSQVPLVHSILFFRCIIPYEACIMQRKHVRRGWVNCARSS